MITRAVSTWSLHRTLGRFAADGSAINGGRFVSRHRPTRSAAHPASGKLAEHGYEAVQICHFHIPSRDARYISSLRQAFESAGIVIDAVLVDDGDLTGPDPDVAEAWISDWLDTARDLGAHRVRVGAGHADPVRNCCATAQRGWCAWRSVSPRCG